MEQPAEETRALSEKLQAFPETGILLMVVLSFLTIGGYLLYWFYSRSRLLNDLLPEAVIPNSFMALCSTGFFVNVVFTLYTESLEKTDPMSQVAFAIYFMVNLLFLVWALLIRQRFNLLVGGDDKPDSANIWLTILFEGWYLQYRINQVKRAGFYSLM